MPEHDYSKFVYLIIRRNFNDDNTLREGIPVGFSEDFDKAFQIAQEWTEAYQAMGTRVKFSVRSVARVESVEG